MKILAIDPGTSESGWCKFVDGCIASSGVLDNHEMLRKVRDFAGEDEHGGVVAIEMIASYGMAVGKEVFETCLWVGRYVQSWVHPESVRLVYRKDVKMHLCGTPRAKDANVRQALIDMLGPQGTKKDPGPTYGVKSHAWAALGVAVTVAATMNRMEKAA